MAEKVFVRDATGLVREIGFFEHLITNMNGVVLTGELGMTLFRIEDCAVPLVRIREQEGGQLLIPFTSIKYIRLLEGSEE